MDAVEVNTSEEPRPREDEEVGMNLIDICRICLIDSPVMRDLYNTDDRFSEKAMNLANVKMMPGDGLPSHICCDCCDKLDLAYKFKLQVEQADNVLRERLDSLNIKEELFFSDVDVNLTSDRNDLTAIASQSLLLKDHIDLLNVQKMSDGDEDLPVENIARHEIQKHDIDNNEEHMQLQEDRVLQQITHEQQIHLQETNDNHDETFGAQELQDMMNEYGNQERLQQDLSQTHQLAMHEHNYVAESQPSEISNENAVLVSEALENNSKEDMENVSMNDQMEIYDTSKELTRRSKRKIVNQHKSFVDSDEENYFENLNLSSRLKHVQSEKSEKVYFMCYLCDRHFLSKEILKEHMHLHEEVRKTLILNKKSPEKPPKTPEKSVSVNSSPTSSRTPTSGKQSNTCPHCGKVYLYIISYNKHLKQHVKQQGEVKEEPMPLEVSFTEDEDALDFHGYNDTQVVNSDSEEEAIKEEKENLNKQVIKKQSLTKCNVCEEEFESMEELRNHRSKHVVEGILTEQDLLTGESEKRENEVIENKKEEVIEEPNSPSSPTTSTHRKSLRRLKNHRCNQCHKSFTNELSLRNHVVATNHKNNIFTQENESEKRSRRIAAKAAQRIIDQIKTDLTFEEEEPKRKSLQCETCDQKYPSKQALSKHVAQHVKEEVKRENELKDEEEDDDTYEGGLDWPMESHECPTCKKQYSTKKSLLRHQLLHEEPNFECDICGIKFYRKDKLKAHYDKCSEKNPDQVRKCNICGDSFENNEILREHRAKHVMEGILTEEDLREIEPRPEDRSAEKAPRKRRTDIVGLECTECNKRYTSRKGLLRHIQVHEGKKYLCDICPKKFYRREHLKIHVAKHNMIKPYKCPRCPKRFIKEEQLNNHLAKHERSSKKVKESDTSKRYLCEICSKSFTQSTTLIAHLRAHNGIKPYVCEVCSRPFTTNAYLKMHMRTHTQERPYICQYCSRAFARADTLANHLTSHTGEAKYHCKYCPKNFRRLKSLKEHVFIHTGQRPYACPTCDRRFNNNGSRYAHSKRCKQNLLQGRTSQISNLEVSEEPQEIQEPASIEQSTISQAQIIKPQNIKTITITRPDGGLTQQHVMAHQEILMPLILPLTVTLTDVGEEVILPEGTKIFTA